MEKLQSLFFYICAGELIMDTEAILAMLTVFSVVVGSFKPSTAVIFRVLNSIMQVQIIMWGS